MEVVASAVVGDDALVLVSTKAVVGCGGSRMNSMTGQWCFRVGSCWILAFGR